MKHFLLVFCCVVLTTSFITASPSPVNDNIGHNEPRHRREIPDECRPPFHRPPHHRDSNEESSDSRPTPPPPPPVCCELPDFMNALNEPEIFGRCHRFVHDTLNPGSRRSHHRHGRKNPAAKSARIARDVVENDDNNKDSQVDKFQEKKECFMSCVFNATGLLNEDAFNEELLVKKLSEAIGNDTKWASIFDPAYKKCLAAAKEANSQSQKTCKAGPAEYMKCFAREFFFNCPSDIWTNNPGCTEFKEKLEKCPNLMPFHPHPPHGHHHHHHHHHHHRRNHHKGHRRQNHHEEQHRVPTISEDQPEEP